MLNGLNYYRNRAERIRKYLGTRDLKALAVLDSLNMIYVSGFHLDVAPWERPVATVIPLDAEPFMILCELSINHYKYGVEKNAHWIRDVRYYDEHPRQTKRRYYAREIDILLSETLEEKGITKGKIAVDSGRATFEKWVKPHLPDLQVVDESKLLREMRLVKDEYELDLIRKAGELSDWGQEKMKQAIRPGKPTVAIGHEVAHALALETARRYPEGYAIDVGAGFTGTGPEGAMPHGWLRPSARKIKKGDSLVDGIGVRLNKYGVENERTFFVGIPTDKQKKYFEVATEAQLKSLDMCVAGNRVSDIDAAAQKVIEDAGFGDYIFHRTGHGIGLGGHEYWDDTGFNHRIMKPGMVTSVEPAIYVYGLGGFRHSDTVIIGKDKPEVTTKYTKRLKDLIVHG